MTQLDMGSVVLFENSDKRARTRFLPDEIDDAVRKSKTARLSHELLGSDVHEK